MCGLSRQLLQVFTIYFKFITKCDKCYYKVRQLFLLQSAMVCYYKVQQLFYYEVRQVLLQTATGITKCDNFITKCDSTHLPFFTCFCMEFAANSQYTLLNTALKRFLPPAWTKLTSLTFERYVIGVWLATPNTVQGGRGLTRIIYIFLT